MTDTWPQALISDLATKRVIVVVGAGVSKNCLSADGTRHPPLWDEFLRAALDEVGPHGTRHIKTAIVNGDYLHACEWLKEKMDDDWIAFLRQQFSDPQFQHCDLHDKIFRLDQRITFSMNIDNIYETYVNTATLGQTIIKKYYDEDVQKFLRDGSNYIVKIHGAIDSPDKLIFTQSDYASARTKYSTFYQVLDAAILSHTFLFVGCGFSDPDLSLLLENQNFKFPQSQPHYIVTSKKISKAFEGSLRRNRNLKCIKYDPSNDHEELFLIMEELVGVLEAKRSSPITSP